MRQLVAIAVVAGALAGCGNDAQAPAQRTQTPTAAVTAVPAARPAKSPERFDADRAFALVRTQVAFGQRPAGSKQLRKLAVRLRGLLPQGRFEPLPKHPGLRNVVGRLPGARPAVVLGAHYDVEAKPDGFVGANDGAAGTAVLVEVARALRRFKRPRGALEVRFVLFDGEEEAAPTDDFYRDALRGSKAYVAAHKGEIGRMVLLDYVGNKNLQLPREATSSVPLWDRVRSAARRVGAASYFPAATGVGITDDHTPFLRAGVPAVDLIDFSYRYRDTVEDTPDKLSTASLDAVGETIVELLRTLR